MNARKLSVLVACSTALAAPAALASEPGAYIGAFAGQASFKVIDKSAIDAALVAAFEAEGLAITSGVSSLDDSDTLAGLMLGYRLNPYFAAEVAYVDLGSAEYRATGTVTDGELDAELVVGASASGKGPVFSLLFSWPVTDRFSPFARVGLSVLETEAALAASATIGAESVSFAERDSTTRSNAIFGIGVDYSMGERFGLRLEWDRYVDAGAEDVTGEGDVDLLYGGVVYRF